MRLSAYLSPQSKTMRFRACLKLFWNLFLLLTASLNSKWVMLLHPRPSHLPQLTLHLEITSLPLPHRHHSQTNRQQHRQMITWLRQQQFTRKNGGKPTKENLSELISKNRLILKPPLRIEEVIKQFNNLKNNIEVVNLSAAEFDQMLISNKDTKVTKGIR